MKPSALATVFIPLALCVSTGQTHAEGDTFSLEVGTTPLRSHLFSRAVERTQGGYVATGHIRYVSDCVPFNCYTDTLGFIVATNEAGQVTFQERPGDLLNDVANLPSGGFVAVGKDNQNACMVVTYSANARPAERWSPCRMGTLLAVEPLSDGRIAVSGEADGGGFVALLSSRGSVLWSYRYDLQFGIDRAWDLALDGDRLVVVGNVAPTGGEFSGHLLILDLDGDVQLVETNVGLCPVGVAVSEAGYTLTGTSRCDTPSDITVSRLDPSGELQWVDTYPAGTAEIGFGGASIEATPDGGFVLASHTTSAARLLFIDGDGDVLSDERYGGSLDQLHYASPTSDGGIIAAGLLGSYGPLGGFTTEAWLLKLSD